MTRNTERLPLPCGQGWGGGSHATAQRHYKERPFFLNKGSKRLLLPRSFPLGGHNPYLATGAGIRVFLLLFLQKKKVFLSFFAMLATLLLPRPAQAQCTQISATSLVFGTYTGQLVTNSTANITLATCTTGFVYSVGLNAGTGAGATVTTRHMTSGAYTLNYQLFQNASDATNWGNTLNIDANTGTTTGASQILTIYANLLTAQYPAPGTYTDTITATALNSGPITTTFTVSATVQATCTITANPLNFGTYLNAPQTATTMLGVTCTNTTPYNVGLSYGTEPYGAAPRRFMIGPGGNGVLYTLSQDAAGQNLWGPTSDGVGFAGVGNGALQTLTVYGQVAPSQYGIPIPGLYTDTIIATVTY